MKSQRMNLCSLILFMCFSLSATVCVSGSTQGNCLRAIDRQIFENWEKNIMESHPRLFFNKSTLEATKERAFGDEKESLKYPMPIIVDGEDDVFVGRIRRDFSIENGLNLWVVGDNLRKGAALNAVQILETLIK